MNENVNKLTEESLKRKERLQALREKALKSNKINENDKQLSKPVFRSYKPQSENATGEILPQGPSGNIESAVEAQLNLLKEPLTIEDVDIASLAPRKSDWDLKRKVAKRLEILDRRTEKAITELIRERLQDNNNQNKQTDLFQAVNVATAQSDTATISKE